MKSLTAGLIMWVRWRIRDLLHFPQHQLSVRLAEAVLRVLAEPPHRCRSILLSVPRPEVLQQPLRDAASDGDGGCERPEERRGEERR